MEIETLFSESIAHAYIFSRSDSAEVISVIEKKFGIFFGKNQNAISYNVETFSIDDARAVTELGNLQSDGDTFVAINARSIGGEAQHALLKTVEEPRAGVHYFIFVENPEMLLPTLRSRCIIVAKGFGENITLPEKGKSKHPDFLTISLAERFAYIEKLSKSLKKDDPNAFRDSAIEIFDSVIYVLREKIVPANTSINSNVKGSATQLERILELRNFLNDRGSSAKQLLEAMAMQL